MTVQSAWSTFVSVCETVTKWCLWSGRLVVAIGIAVAIALALLIAGCSLAAPSSRPNGPEIFNDIANRGNHDG